jgi:spore coat protein CotF
MNTAYFSDKEMITDVLSTQRFITSGYNTTATEASGPKIKSTLVSILEEEQGIGHDIFVEMQNRGWYQTESAPQNKVDQAKEKFSSQCKTC